MSAAGAIRLAGFVIPAAGALAVMFWTGSFWWFAAALVGALAIGMPVEMAYRRAASLDEQRRDLEGRVRNPP